MEAAAGVTYAHFRPATAEEIVEAKGGIFSQIITKICQVISTIFGTYYVSRNQDFRTWDTSSLLKFIHRIKAWSGSIEPPFMKIIDTYLARIYIIDKEEKLGKAFFKLHRNDGIFESSISMKKIYEMIRKAFPEDEFNYNDFILTCDRENTTKYRHMLMRNTLSQKHIDAYIPTMQTIIDRTLKDWFEKQGKEGIEITNASRVYASSVFSKLMFGEEVSSDDLADCINSINSITMKILRNNASKEEQSKFESILKTLREIVLKVLEREDIPLFKDTELTSAQKKAMIFALLFAGQETTSTLLSYMLWQLALKPEMQEELYQALINEKEEKLQLKIIESIFTQSIRLFPPAFAVGRSFGADTCLEYKWGEETTLRKKIFFKDEIAILYSGKFAESLSIKENDHYDAAFVLGEGPHACVGKKLALAETTHLLFELVKNYKITTNQTTINTTDMITLCITDKIHMSMTKRE